MDGLQQFCHKCTHAHQPRDVMKDACDVALSMAAAASVRTLLRSATVLAGALPSSFILADQRYTYAFNTCVAGIYYVVHNKIKFCFDSDQIK